jgi:hypothetical protein
MGVEELAERLEAIAEELADLSLDRLRRATRGTPGAPADAAAVAEERRLTRARRAVQKAAVVLRQAEAADGTEGVASHGVD